MKYELKIIRKKVNNGSPNSESKIDSYHEIVNMKCTECNYCHEMDADVVLNFFDPRKNEYPRFLCPNCKKGDLVPEEIYDQIKKP